MLPQRFLQYALFSAFLVCLLSTRVSTEEAKAHDKPSEPLANDKSSDPLQSQAGESQSQAAEERTLKPNGEGKHSPPNGEEVERLKDKAPDKPIESVQTQTGDPQNQQHDEAILSPSSEHEDELQFDELTKELQEELAEKLRKEKLAPPRPDNGNGKASTISDPEIKVRVTKQEPEPKQTVHVQQESQKVSQSTQTGEEISGEKREHQTESRTAEHTHAEMPDTKKEADTKEHPEILQAKPQDTVKKDTPSYNILMLPFDVGSHLVYFSQLGKDLISRGHTVTVIHSSAAKIPSQLENTGIKIDQYFTPKPIPAHREEYGGKLLDIIFNFDIVSYVNNFNEMAKIEEEHTLYLLQDEEVMKRIQNEHYDFVVTDMLSGPFQIIPYKFNIPYGCIGLDIMFPVQRRTPYLPSYVPYPFSSFSDRMTFTERLTNFFLYAVASIGVENRGMEAVATYAPEKPVLSYSELLSNMDLYITMKNVAISTPRAVMPDTISIASLLGTPANPLPEDILNLVENAPDGVIVCSLGSWMDNIPLHILDTISDALSQSKQLVIWKHGGTEMVEIPDHIKVLKWIPQNDLLGHPNVRLFITHGGLTSLVETVYHGVPVISLGLALDQWNNAAMIHEKKAGISLDIMKMTSADLVNAMNTVIYTPAYSKNMKLLSNVYRDIQDSGIQNPSFWIEHVIQHGSGHLRSSAYNMPWHQYLMLDILMFLAGVSLFIAILFCRIVKCCCRCWCRCCCWCCCRGASKKKID